MFERRQCAILEAREENGNPILVGYASTFDQPYQVGRGDFGFTEVVDRNAFARTLGRSPDVRLLVDHQGQPLARTKSGTLQLSTDDRGLLVRAQLEPSDPDVQRIIPKLRRGDLDQMSFAFFVPADGDEWNSDFTVRTLRNVELDGGDVSIVTFPANPNTTVALRSRRSEMLAVVDGMLREIRAGRDLSEQNLNRLKSILDLLAQSDQAMDQALADLSAFLAVPNPDEDRLPEPTEGVARAADDPNKPYGDVPYADPGYQPDGKKRYPLDNVDHVKAAWAYINMPKNQKPYTKEQLQNIMDRIKAAAKKFGIEISDEEENAARDLLEARLGYLRVLRH